MTIPMYATSLSDVSKKTELLKSRFVDWQTKELVENTALSQLVVELNKQISIKEQQKSVSINTRLDSITILPGVANAAVSQSAAPLFMVTYYLKNDESYKSQYCYTITDACLQSEKVFRKYFNDHIVDDINTTVVNLLDLVLAFRRKYQKNELVIDYSSGDKKASVAVWEEGDRKYYYEFETGQMLLDMKSQLQQYFHLPVLPAGIRHARKAGLCVESKPSAKKKRKMKFSNPPRPGCFRPAGGKTNKWLKDKMEACRSEYSAESGEASSSASSSSASSSSSSSSSSSVVAPRSMVVRGPRVLGPSRHDPSSSAAASSVPSSSSSSSSSSYRVSKYPRSMGPSSSSSSQGVKRKRGADNQKPSASGGLIVSNKNDRLFKQSIKAEVEKKAVIKSESPFIIDLT